MQRIGKSILYTGLILVLLLSPSTSLQSLVSAETETPPLHIELVSPEVLPTASSPTAIVREGRYPAQLAGVTGAVQPSRYGPQRNDPAEGIPRYAYSPFDERNNREHPCPSGGCESVAGYVLLKLEPEIAARQNGPQAALTSHATLNQALSAQGIVRLEPVFPTARAPRPGALLATPNGDLIPEPDLTRWQQAYLDEKADAEAALSMLTETDGVAWVELDYLRKPAGDFGATAYPAHLQSFTDPLYAQQWHLDATNVPAAWQWLEDEGYAPGGSRDVVVAVIDTGVDYTHPDLAANMWINAAEFYGTPGMDDDGNGYIDDIHGVTTVSGQRSGDPQDDHGHGTHVAGIIAAQAGNSIGGVGVAYNVQIMAIKAAQYSGVLAASDIAAGIYYAVDKGADVINMSFGGYARSQVEEDALAVAFGQAVLVAAAGNDGWHNDWPCKWPIPPRTMYPAAYNWVLGVMASTQEGGLAYFSNWDCTAHDTREYELAAPGVEIWSTLPNMQYAAWAGTSMAAPVVSGIAALARTRWSDKGTYSSRFIMGQIASNTSGGVADALAALTTSPQPELSYLQHWLFDTPDLDPINDNDGIVDAGETVDLAIVIRNHWGKAEPVTVTLEAWAEGAFQPDPYVTMITDTVQYGAIGSFNWKDNGLIYSAEGAVVGVEHPFRFTTIPDTPNDHLIPFRLTITADNGYSTDDPNAPYTFVSHFFLVVQRGRELPRVITEDLILSSDYYWLIPDKTLIESGVTVTVTEGAQIQFWSVDPAHPYAPSLRPYLQIDGNLVVSGTLENPVEFFNGILWPGRPVDIRGNATIRYALVQNPMVSVSSVDRAHFSQELSNCIVLTEPYCWEEPSVGAQSVTNSRFLSVGYDHPRWVGASPLRVGNNITSNLYSFCYMWADYIRIASGNVFLGNRRSDTPASSALDPGYSCVGCSPESGHGNNEFRNNAILNVLWDSNINNWMRFVAPRGSSIQNYISNNYWGTVSPTIIDAIIQDYNDDWDLGTIIYQPILTEPPEMAYPFVVDVYLSTAAEPDTLLVGAEVVTFTVTFNRDMDTAIQPAVSFGPDEPYTDYTVRGDWVDPRTWQGTYLVTPVTGDGYQLIRVAGAVAADDAWLVTGDDAGRFRFEVETSGTAAMNLQANGGEGYVDLMWTQTDFDLLAGFNLYRATTIDGEYARLNGSIIPPDQRDWRDTDVIPGQPYYYKFTVVQTSMAESDFSNIATGTPIDTIAPVIDHAPVTSAPPGLPLTLNADVTDNVAVQSVTLFYRALGGSTYSSRAMVKTTGDRHAATLEGSLLVSPGIEYYIEASDGINITRSGRPDYPHQIVVVDRPVVTIVTPNHGPAGGGTTVTLSGSNFKAGAIVAFGGAAASNVTVISGNQITCTTPAHFPETVDVTVTNPDAQSGTLLRGYIFEAGTAALGLPHTGGGQHAIVQVPVNLANVTSLAAASLIVTFDPAVLEAQGATVGNLTPGWSIAANTATPGEIRISMASGGGTVSGSGTLALITFDVVGAAGANSVLHPTAISLNDGAIPVESADGSFTVDLVYSISGAIPFWNGGVVSGTLLTLTGDRLYTGLSDASGAYTVANVPADDYTLTPSKSSDVNGISAYDASLALQHDVGLITLSGYAFTAADVNRSGAVTAMDAFYILQKAVDLIALPFPGAGRVWDFAPQNRAYTNLSSNLTGQDFTAILLGDPSGNWTPPVGIKNMARTTLIALDDVTATLALDEVDVLPGEQVTASLMLTLPTSAVYGIDIEIIFDSTVVSAVQVTKGALIPDWMLSTNLSTPGMIQVALAGAIPASGSGELLQLTFEAVGPTGADTDLELTRGDLNEGALPVIWQNGALHITVPIVDSIAVLQGPFDTGEFYPFAGTINCGGITFTDTGTLNTILITLTYQYPTSNHNGLPRYYNVEANGNDYEAQLHLCYTDDDLQDAGIPPEDEADLRAFRWTGSEWEMFPSTVNSGTKIITVENVTQFSIWGIGTPNAKPTAITLYRFGPVRGGNVMVPHIYVVAGWLTFAGWHALRRRNKQFLDNSG